MTDKNAPLARPAKPAVLTDYQPGAIVSRQLVTKKNGTVTVFAFDKGQMLSEHTSVYDALVQVLEGEAHIRVSGKDFAVMSGETLLMPAGEPHSLKAVKRFKMLLTLMR